MLLAAFLQQCENDPQALALAEGERALTYKELRDRALAVAVVLRDVGAEPGQRISIHLDRGIDAVVAIFGVLLAGACYVPLDLKNPAARLRFIVADADVAAVIGKDERPDWATGKKWLDHEKAFIAPPHPKPLLEGEGINSLSPDALAAILYTSGSTGQPKGVALSHGAIAAFAHWAAELVNLNPADRVASLAPLFFDLSTFDLYAALGRGASLHFVPSTLTLAPARLGTWLREQAITGWYTVPSLLTFLAYKGNLAESRSHGLRFLLFAGEVFPAPALRDLAEKLPSTRLFNFFGPTETNVCCYWEVDRARLRADEAIPIGHAAVGDELRVDSATGELRVRGPTLASGYWSRGELHGFSNSEGWYATGDRVSWNDHGELLFHGRLGRMLKCAGYRVEPAEIEAAINALPGVAVSAVVGINDAAGGQRPAAVWLASGEVSEHELRQYLKSRLPPYMQPARLLRIAEMPLLANGKTDWVRVRELLEVTGLGR